MPETPLPSSLHGAAERRAAAVAAKRAQRAAQRRDAIVAAALDEFSQRGFGAARLEDVAGVAKGTIYLYFKDKDALFRELVTTSLAPVFDRLRFDVPVEVPTRTLLDDFADTFLRDIYATPRINILRMVIAEGRHFPDLVDFYYREVVERGVGVMRALLQRGIDREEIPYPALARFPQLAIAPLLMAIIWNGLFRTHAELDARAIIAAQYDLIFAQREER
jgi:AcrR family transcriptional regulator